MDESSSDEETNLMMVQKNAPREKETQDLLKKVEEIMDYEQARKASVDPDTYHLILPPMGKIHEEFKEMDACSFAHDDPNGIAITTSPLAMDNVANDDPNGIVLCIMRIHVSFI